MGRMMGAIITGAQAGIRLDVFDKAGEFDTTVGLPYQNWEAFRASLHTA